MLDPASEILLEMVESENVSIDETPVERFLYQNFQVAHAQHCNGALPADPDITLCLWPHLDESVAEEPACHCPIEFSSHSDHGKCQTASNRDPGSAWKRDPSPALGQACPGSEQEGPARVAQCPHERRSGARGRCLFAHRGKPGWHSSAVFEAPALVAGFDDFAVMRQSIEQRGRHLGVCEDARPFAEGQVGCDDDGGALVKAAD